MTDDVQVEPPPFQPLYARLAGLPLDRALYEDVPKHLERPLRGWLRRVLQRQGLSRRVALRLEIVVPSYGKATYDSELVGIEVARLLEVVDAALCFHPVWDGDPEPDWAERQIYAGMVDEIRDLADILRDGGSAFRVDVEQRRLVRRVQETVQAAADLVLGSAEQDVAQNLRTAWIKAYGVHPDPDDAYDHAIKAVEGVAGPLVLPKDPAPTLGKVISCLDQGRVKWRLALVDKAEQGDVGPLVVMMRRLWEGHRSRHAGGSTSRPQTKLEAEAAVHLAVILVQWLASGVLSTEP